MKKIGAIIVAIVCVALVCGGFYMLKSRGQNTVENSTKLSDVQKITTRDLEKSYPSTPREVVKLYNKIITCYYSTEFKNGELEDLADQAIVLFDDDLKAKNPREIYLSALKSEIAEYKGKSKSISQSTVCSSNDVLYLTDKDDDIAFVNTSYFIKEGSDHNKTYEQFILRKDDQGRWKILGYYQIDGAKADSDL